MVYKKRNSGIFDFIDGIMPSFEKIQIENEIDRVMKDMKEVIIPALDIPDVTLERTVAHQMIDRQLGKVAPHYRGKPIDYLKKLCVITVDGKPDLNNLIDKAFNTKITKEGLDYKRGHLLHLISLLEFFNQFCIQLLLVTTKEVLDDKYYPVDKRAREFVTSADNVEKFGTLCAALEHKFSNFGKLMRAVDGITIDKDTREASETVLGDDSDPFNTGFYTVDFNPFYLVGKMANQVYLFWFDIKREQARKLTLHVAKLKQRQEGASEETIADLDKIIAHHSDRLNTLNAEIEEVLEDANTI